MEELNAANKLQLGVIEIYTNGAKHYKEAEFAEVFNLDGNIDCNKECDDNTIRSILDFIEKIRANLLNSNSKLSLIKLKLRTKINLYVLTQIESAIQVRMVLVIIPSYIILYLQTSKRQRIK